MKLLVLCALAVAVCASAEVLAADAMKPAVLGVGLPARPFPQTDGPGLYEAICQACHMPNAVGASGAGTYPALAKNAHLAAKRYAVSRVLNGSKAMPPFKAVLSDEQIATLVGYIRTHFGNHYKDPVSVADVKALRE